MSDPRTEQESGVTPGTAETAALAGTRLAVAVRGAAKTYPNGLRALEPIDIDVREGDFTTLLGPSGCGKSTLLRMIGGLSAPTTGSVLLAHRSGTEAAVSGTSDTAHFRQRASGLRNGKPRLAFVFQSPTLMPWASVQRNVRLPLDLAGRSRRQRASRSTPLCGWSD